MSNELPGMWEESDFKGGETDNPLLPRYELHVGVLHFDAKGKLDQPIKEVFHLVPDDLLAQVVISKLDVFEYHLTKLCKSLLEEID